MFYLIIGVLLALYYVFMAPKTIKSTMNMVLLVGLLALVLVFGVLGLIKVIQAPPEIFVGVGMTILGLYALRDVLQLESREDKQDIKS